MAPLRRHLLRVLLATLLAGLFVVGRPGSEQARANPVCDVVTSPAAGITGGIGVIAGGVGLVTGGIGGGNPLSDACDSITDDAVDGAVDVASAPVEETLEGIRNGIFEQIGAWAAEGAAWLIGRATHLIDKTTSPKLTAKGFVEQYTEMAEIAVVLAAAMLLFAVLEGLAQGSLGMLARSAFVNLPLAFLGTSVAFVVVQLLIGATDGLSHAVASSTGQGGKRFFEEAMTSLSALGSEGGAAVANSSGDNPVEGAIGEASGAFAVPLFVGFLAACVGAFAAFFVWIELLMRDAAIYAVALFMPLALAASIWPRWAGALRRTAELLVVLIASKFVIVAIISLAAGLLANNAGAVEQILAAAALMLLACFAPFVLLRLVPFAEGAMAAAYGRRSSGGAVSGTQLVTQVQMMQRTARANWGGTSSSSTAALRLSGGGGGEGGGQAAGRVASGGGSAGGGGAASAAGSQAGAASAAAAPAAAAAIPVLAAKGSERAAERLAGSATAQTTEGGEASPSSGAATSPGARAARADSGAAETSGKPAESVEPRDAPGGGAPGAGERPPRPAAEPSPSKAKERSDS